MISDSKNNTHDDWVMLDLSKWSLNGNHEKEIDEMFSRCKYAFNSFYDPDDDRHVVSNWLHDLDTMSLCYYGHKFPRVVLGDWSSSNTNSMPIIGSATDDDTDDTDDLMRELKQRKNPRARPRGRHIVNRFRH